MTFRVLSLDLGTSTGWATNASGKLESGTWKLATAKEVTTWSKERLTRRRDPRIPRLAEKLAGFCGKIDAIVYEDVLFGTFTKQTQLWASLRAAVWLACGGCGLIEAIPVGTLKKFAADHGGATKPMMESALKKKHPSLYKQGATDDEIDAIWIFKWAEKHLCRTKLN